MRSLALVLLQIRYEQKLYWRSPSSAMFTFLFPILLLVIFASLNYGATLRALGGISYNQYYVPGSSPPASRTSPSASASGGTAAC